MSCHPPHSSGTWVAVSKDTLLHIYTRHGQTTALRLQLWFRLLCLSVARGPARMENLRGKEWKVIPGREKIEAA